VVARLASGWSEALGGLPLALALHPRTLLLGFALAWAAGLAAIWVGVRRLAQLPARALLAGDTVSGEPAAERDRPGRGRWLLPGVLLVSAGLLLIAGRSLDPRILFFLLGSTLLCGLLWLSWRLLQPARVVPAPPRSRGPRLLLALTARNVSRQPGRSFATLCLFALASFTLVAVGAARHGSPPEEGERAGPTGGFALFARSSRPLFSDLNTPQGRAEVLGAFEPPAGFRVIALRTSLGDEASCRNPYRPRQPRVLGVPPEFVQRAAFRFASTAGSPARNPWTLLEAGGEEIPAIADMNTLMWSLELRVGDVVTLLDGRGRDRRCRIVAALQPSILQGALLVSEPRFLELFPSSQGARTFLIDCPPGTGDSIARALEEELSGLGFDATSTARRFAEFTAVERTYMAAFQALGGLGLLLGTFGLAALVLRNALERRGELALLRVLGFTSSALRWFLVVETGTLLGGGLAVGAVSALVAMGPSVAAAGGGVAWLPPVALVGLALACGLLASSLAARAALRGEELDGLRGE
jgi:hypothetical protein